MKKVNSTYFKSQVFNDFFLNLNQLCGNSIYFKLNKHKVTGIFTVRKKSIYLLEIILSFIVK